MQLFCWQSCKKMNIFNKNLGNSLFILSLSLCAAILLLKKRALSFFYTFETPEKKEFFTFWKFLAQLLIGYLLNGYLRHAIGVVQQIKMIKHMKLIMAIIKPFKLDDVREAISNIGN